MGKALIIGAGGVANVVAHKCCQVPEVFEEICLASRTLKKCQDIKDKLQGSKTKIEVAQVDADITDEVINPIEAFKPDIVINGAALSGLKHYGCLPGDWCTLSDTANYEP